jgi:hypothetical protein
LRIERNSLTEEEEKAYLEEERSAVVRRTAVRRRGGATVMKMVWRCREEEDGSILRFAFLRLFSVCVVVN